MCNKRRTSEAVHPRLCNITYNLECKVDSIVPYVEEVLEGDFHYLRLRFQGCCTPQSANTGDLQKIEFDASILARPKIRDAQQPSFGFGDLKEKDFIFFSDNGNEIKQKTIVASIVAFLKESVFLSEHTIPDDIVRFVRNDKFSHPTLDGVEVPYAK